MGNALEGKTYHKGSHRSIQPKIASNIDMYKSQQRVSSSSNIHSQISFNRARSEMVPRRTFKKIDDISNIHDEGYSDTKYGVKKLSFVTQVKLGQMS